MRQSASSTTTHRLDPQRFPQKLWICSGKRRAGSWREPPKAEMGPRHHELIAMGFQAELRRCSRTHGERGRPRAWPQRALTARLVIVSLADAADHHAVARRLSGPTRRRRLSTSCNGNGCRSKDATVISRRCSAAIAIFQATVSRSVGKRVRTDGRVAPVQATPSGPRRRSLRQPPRYPIERCAWL
jgi:hypothetical protein